MSVSDWGEVFSGPLFQQRLAEDYLLRADEYVTEYHRALKDKGKISAFWQYPFIAGLDVVKLSRYTIVGSYTRFEETVLNELKDARQKIVSGIKQPSGKRENHLIWAAPGSGKSFFVQQIAEMLSDACTYVELNLGKVSEEDFRTQWRGIVAMNSPCLCLIDEVDSQPDATWPYEVLLPYLDEVTDNQKNVVVVMAGSSGYSLAGLKERIGARPKGKDLLSRIPTENECVIAPMSFGDRILVVLSQFARAGRKTGRDIRAVEKLGLYYIALSSKLSNARQLYEFTLRAVERGPHNDDRVKYDQLFMSGDPENKRFWLEVSPVSKDLVNHYVKIED
ncbi:MAG: AAA family ATPase [Anaerolineales bacterium]|nr:AAA family ATPase [Anaerolineales bacterium]